MFLKRSNVYKSISCSMACALLLMGCSEVENKSVNKEVEEKLQTDTRYNPIDININNGKIVSGFIDENNNVFTPIKPLEEEYKLYGSLSDDLQVYSLNYSNALIREIDDYSAVGPYLNFDKMNVESWAIVEIDEQGIPKNNYKWGTYYYPITIAHYGLEHYSIYQKNPNEVNEEIFLKVADWFVDHQDDNGGWPAEFDHMFYKGRTEMIKGPWYSAMAQGMAISNLVRAYDHTGNKEYLNAAMRGYKIYTIPVEDGGVLRKFEDEYFFYEEYPTEPASYVLNGFMFSLLGLYDLYYITKDENVYELYKEGIRTLERMMPLYDLGNRTAYDLTHYTTEGTYPNVARWAYHATHIHLLEGINSIENNQKFEEILKRWQGYTKGITVKEN